MSTYSDSLLLKNEKVCQSVDIRRRSHLIQLENCTVIEGDLYIVMVTLLPKQSFPLLKEITGSLVIYYVIGIKTLENYFPNLTVIRGQTLAYNYAVVIKETNLLYLGLVNLRVILFGGIRIDNNPSLCYISSINWQYIIKQSGAPVKMVLTRNICPDFCPKNCTQKTQEEYCWSYKSCQNVCSKTCTSNNIYCYMNDSNLCCHAECLGGCYGEGNDKCVSCKNVLSEGRCEKNCQESFYKYKNRRCISKQECAKLSSQSSTDYRRRDLYAIEGDSCVKQCSAGKERDVITGHCVVCGANCSKKYCGKILIHSINDLITDVDGCYSIEEIYISIKEGGPMLSEILTKSFSKLRVIENSLKIIRSSSIKSLNFLKPLNLIKGNLAKKSQKNETGDNANKSFVFEVYDNENLVEISNDKLSREQFNITILHGSVTFNLNRKLCPEKILKFIKNNIHSKTKLSVLEENIINVSNGDMTYCKHEKLNVTIKSISHSSVTVLCNSKITTVLSHDSGARSSFMLKETEKNVTQYELSNSCSYQSWRIIQGQLGKLVTISELKPAKRYAFYVEAIRSSIDNWLEISDVIYFTTKTKNPSPPRNLKTISLSDSEIKLTWNPPLSPNGKVIKYIIRYRRFEIHNEEFKQNDRCSSESRSRIPVGQSKMKISSETDSHGNSNNINCDCNSCMASCNQNLQNHLIDTEDSDFHLLDDFILQKFRKQNRIPTSYWIPSETDIIEIRQKPNNSNIYMEPITFGPPPPSPKKNRSSLHNPRNQSLKMVTVSADKHFHIFSNLHHYTEYFFEVQACQNPVDEKIQKYKTNYQIEDAAHLWESLCSLSSSISGNTLPKEGVDNIDETTIESFVMGNSIKITWQEPIYPNGLILNFLLKYRDLSFEKSHDWLAESCITRFEWLNEKNLILNTSDYLNNTSAVFKKLSNKQQSGSIILKNLDPGHYEYQIKPLSIPSNGSWTKSFYFVIPQNSIFKIYRTLFIIGFFLIILLVILAIGLMYYYYRKRYLTRTKWVSSNPEYWIIYEIDEWEIDRKDVDLMEWNHPLGRGSFGMVYKGILRKLTTPAKAQFPEPINTNDLYVAVKTLNANSTILERREFINEACYMKQFQSYHLVKLFGVVSKINFSDTKKHNFSKELCHLKFPLIDRIQHSVRWCFSSGISIFKTSKSVNLDQLDGQINDIYSNKISFKTTISQHFQKMPLVVMELMEYGDLAGYLRKQGEEGEGVISDEQSYLWALQIADGMLYLSEMKFVHRDLAARNCMINNLLIIKIGDFGMARDIYYDCYYRKEGKGRLPVRWMAPEALKSAYFTISSDVWSYGVILWEISTLSSLPYRGMSHHDVIQFVTNGGTLLNNGSCSFPKLILNVMENCWKYNPEDRPTFFEICEKLELHSDSNFQQNSHYFIQKCYSSNCRDVNLLDIYLNSENYIDNGIQDS